MPILAVIACSVVAICLAAGQILFKHAAEEIKARLDLGLFTSLLSPWLLAALILYAVTTAMWVAVLTRVPLSQAYPYVLTAGPLVSLWSWYALGEPIGIRYVFGLGLVLVGLALIQSDA